jgi:sugar transferase/asparagine synthase
VGRAGRIFTIYKLRTLAPDADTRLGPYLELELTRRTETEVTSIGRALRATHLDEIPQLWNVLRGDMSMVGPRPIRARKQGFSVPMAAWLRGQLEPFAREVLASETVARQGYFHPGQVSRLIDAHVAGREDLSRQIWGLMAFTLWVERYASSAVPVRAAS